MISTTLAKEFPYAALCVNDNLETTLNEYTDKVNSKDKQKIVEGLKSVNESMTFNMHPLGYTLTVGDFSLWGAIKGNPQVTTEALSGKYSEIERWYKEFMEHQPVILQVAQFIKDLSAAEASATKPKSKTASFKLEGAEQGKVVTRFPPEVKHI